MLNRSLKFAIFPSRERAERARKVLDTVADAEVELVATTDELTRDKVPLDRTLARRGVLFGAMTVGLSTALVSVSLFAAGLGDVPITPLVTTLAAVILGSALGGLAGGLAFMTETPDHLRALKGRMRAVAQVLERRPVMLLLRSRTELRPVLLRHGAVEVGTL